MVGSGFDGAVDNLRVRLSTCEGKAKLRLRMLAEHPFGMIKRVLNHGYMLLRRLSKVKGEVGSIMLA
jgi:hypothetical protein